MKNLTIWLRWASMCGLPFLPTTGTCTPSLITVMKSPTHVGSSPIVKLSSQEPPVPMRRTFCTGENLQALPTESEISQTF